MLPGRDFAKITNIDDQVVDVDCLFKVRMSWLGQLYINYFRRFVFFHSLALWLWRHFFPAYSRFVVAHLGNRYEKRWREALALRFHVAETGSTLCKLADRSEVVTPRPQVSPASSRDLLVSPHERYEFPEVYVAELGTGKVLGGTNLLLVGEKVICHDLFDFRRDYTSEELHGRILVDPNRKRIRLLQFDETPEKLSVAASFVDACAPNYAHWLTEVLPRVALFCSESQFSEVPVVVNAGLHANIMESLAFVVGSSREVITLPASRTLVVDTLFVTSVAGYVPFEPRTRKLDGHSHGLFSPVAFELIRKRVGGFFNELPGITLPKKIFIRRNSGLRKIANYIDVENFFLSKGYAIVEPEKMSFLQQAAVFKNAEVIVGSSGAAFSNIVFCDSSTRIFILIGKYIGTSYWYWQNIACSVGNVVNYIICDSLDKGIHSDIFVDMDNLSSAI